MLVPNWVLDLCSNKNKTQKLRRQILRIQFSIIEPNLKKMKKIKTILRIEKCK
jgi:hypothetical protein